MHPNISDIALEPRMDSSQIAQLKCYRVIKLSRVVSYIVRKIFLLRCLYSNSAVSLYETRLL